MPHPLRPRVPCDFEQALLTLLLRPWKMALARAWRDSWRFSWGEDATPVMLVVDVGQQVKGFDNAAEFGESFGQGRGASKCLALTFPSGSIHGRECTTS